MPKNVLYVAENALSPMQGGGIVAQATLHGLPAEHLLGFYVYTNITPALEYADRFHALPNLAYRNRRAPPFPLPLSPLDARPQPLLRALVSGTRARLRSLAEPLPSPLGGGDWRLVEQRIRADGFRPEIVFAAPLSLRLLQLAVKAASVHAVPLVLLNMDDWIAHESFQLGPLHHLWQRRVARVMAAAKPHVRYAYSNSERLASRLSQRYGIPHETMNNASPDLLAGRPSWAPPPSRTGHVLAYAGALNWRLQGQTLARVAEAVAELRFDRDVELRVYTPWEFAPLANLLSVPGAVTYGGFLPPGELVERYLDADFLLATTTFVEQNLHLFRHSLATKLSDYLCVGRPVLSVGHPDWAAHDYVEENGCGSALRAPLRTEIKQGILAALATPREERHRIGQSNRRLWERAHDVRVLARRLREIVGLDEPA